MRTSRWLLGCSFLVSTTGCGLEPEPSGRAVAGTTDRLFVPVQPRTEVELPSFLPPTATVPSDGAPLRAELPIHLAVGDDYAKALTIHLDEHLAAPCEDGVYAARFATTFDQLELEEGSASPVTIVHEGDRRLEVQISEVGEGRYKFSGTGVMDQAACGLEEGAELPLEIILVVDVHEVRSRVRPACDVVAGEIGEGEPVLFAPLVAAGRNLNASLIDEEGEPYVALNAQPDAQVAVELRGDLDLPDRRLRRDGSDSEQLLSRLANWYAPARPGLITLTPEGGAELDVEVLSAERMTDTSVAFNLAGAKTPRVAPLVEGTAYDHQLYLSGVNLVAPVAVGPTTTDAGTLCSAPPPHWFELETSTPSICRIALGMHPADDINGGVVSLGGPAVAAGAEMLTAGTCALRLTAPASGWATDFAVTFTASAR